MAVGGPKSPMEDEPFVEEKGGPTPLVVRLRDQPKKVAGERPADGGRVGPGAVAKHE